MLGLVQVASFWGRAGSLDSKHHGTALTQLPSQELLDRESETKIAQPDSEELSQQESFQQKELEAASTAETSLQQQELASASTAETSLQQKELASLWLKALKPRASSFILVTFLLVIVGFIVGSFENFRQYCWQLSGLFGFIPLFCSFRIVSFQDAARPSRIRPQLRSLMVMFMVVFGQGELLTADSHPHLRPQLPRVDLGHRHLADKKLQHQLGPCLRKLQAWDLEPENKLKRATGGEKLDIHMANLQKWLRQLDRQLRGSHLATACSQLRFQLAECFEIPMKIRTEKQKNFADKLSKLDDQKLTPKLAEIDGNPVSTLQLSSSRLRELVEHFKTIGKSTQKLAVEKFFRAHAYKLVKISFGDRELEGQNSQSEKFSASNSTSTAWVLQPRLAGLWLCKG